MKYTAITYDGERYAFGERSHQAVLAAMKTGEPVEMGERGQFVKGSDIRRIEQGDTRRAQEYGPHLAQRDARDVFQLAAGSPGSFWKEVFFINGRRKAEGRPWLYARLVERARRESGFTDAATVIDFIDAEWETIHADAYNEPDPPRSPDAEASRISREYLSAMEGMEYAERERRVTSHLT